MNGSNNENGNGSKWTHIKHWIWKYIGTLLMDTKLTTNPTTGKVEAYHTMSLGRVSFAILLCHALWIWSGFAEGGTVLQSGEKELLFVMASYNFGTKAVNIFKKNNGAPPQ